MCVPTVLFTIRVTISWVKCLMVLMATIVQAGKNVRETKFLVASVAEGIFIFIKCFYIIHACTFGEKSRLPLILDPWSDENVIPFKTSSIRQDCGEEHRVRNEVL